MKARPRGRVIALLAGVAVIWAAGAYLHHWRMTWDIVARSSWPAELQEMIADLRRNGIVTGDIDVRSAGLITTYCWRMPADDRVIDAHIDRFDLTPVAANGIEAQRIHERFPIAWSWPGQHDLACFADPPGLPGAQEGEFEFVMLHDKTANELFFYYYFNF